MPRMTGAAAQHVMLLRVWHARDAYEVFGWTAASVFSFAEIRARTAEFYEAMDYDQSPVWWSQPQAVRMAFRAVRLRAYKCWTWAMQIVADRSQVMDDLSGDETDMEA